MRNPRLARRASLTSSLSLVVTTLFLPLLGTAPAVAATTAASSVSGSGTDATHASTATASTAGSAKGGDTLNWVMNYANNHTSPSDVTFNSALSGPQSLVAGTQQVPTGTTATSSAGNVGFTATNYTPASKYVSGGMTSTTIGTLQSAGGDGWNGVGIGSEVYAVYHHITPTVYCSNLDGSVCANWPNGGHDYSPAAGAGFQTMTMNGTFVLNGKLYWPEVNLTASAPGRYPVGLGCFNTVTKADCGFIQGGLSQNATGPYGNEWTVTGDGIAATNGNFYYATQDGDVYCYGASGACAGTSGLFGAHSGANRMNGSQTMGQYFFATVQDKATGHMILGCYDTAADANCNGYPVDTGVADSSNGEIDPVLDQNGAILGACVRPDAVNFKCYSSTAGTASTITSPYGATNTMGGAFTLAGQGAIAGNRFYQNDLSINGVKCFEFTAPGVASACPGFTPQAGTSAGGGTVYTTRALANLPGCFVTDADSHQIQIFDGTDGGPCPAAKQTASLAPLSYCDGQTHSTTWGTLSTTGLTGSEYSGGTVTLEDSLGNPVAGWSGKSFTGALNLDLSSIPTTGATAGLTATVLLTGVKPDATTQATVAAATVVMTRTGDTYSQLCYQTQVDPGCHASGTVSSNGTAVTTNAGTSDAPGNSSGDIKFGLTAGSECMLHITKKASTQNPQPGQVVTFTIDIANVGTADYTAAAPAAIDDNMSNALKHAAYNNDAVASAGTTAYTAPHLTWSGPLAHGTSVTITYTMTVSPKAPTGVQLVNVVSSSSPSNCGVGSKDPVCVATMATTQSKLKLVKTESTATPRQGGQVRYTIKITNVGKTDYNASAPAVMRDQMQGVLKYATFVRGSAKASSGTVTRSGSLLVWKGALAHGATVTVTYIVKVKPNAAGHALRNFVTSPNPSNCSKGTEKGCHVTANVKAPVVPLLPDTGFRRAL